MKKLTGIIAIVMILITLVFSNIAIADSPSLMDGYITVDNNDNQTSSPAEIKGQTWTASSSYRMSYIEIYMRRTGDPGTIVLNIRTVSDGNPSNTNLVSVELDASSVPVSNSWVRFDLPSTEISDGSVYWWGVYALSGNATSDCYSVRVNKNEGYTGGSMTISPDGGKTWYAFADIGSLFQIYGEALPASTPTPSITPTPTPTSVFKETPTPTATTDMIPIITIVPTATIQPTETPTPTPTPTVIPAPIAPTSHSNTWLIVLGVIGGLIVIGGGVYLAKQLIHGYGGSRTGKNPLSPAPYGGGILPKPPKPDISAENKGAFAVSGKNSTRMVNPPPDRGGDYTPDNDNNPHLEGASIGGSKRGINPLSPAPDGGGSSSNIGRGVIVGKEGVAYRNSDQTSSVNNYGINDDGIKRTAAPDEPLMPETPPSGREVTMHGEPVPGAEIYVELEPEGMKLAKPDGSGAGNAGGASAKGKLIDSIAKKAALTKSQAKKAHEKPPIKPIRLEIQSSGEPVKGAEIYIELEEEEEP